MEKIVENGSVISIEYEGYLEDGSLFDSTGRHGGEPLVFRVGTHEIIEGLEKAVLGRKEGEEFEITIPPDEAYGEYDPNFLQEIPRDMLPPGDEPQPGMFVQMKFPHEDHMHYQIATIKEVGKEFIILDLNHPLAGKNLLFKVKILKIE